jgi:uncharacterized iron-regulated membrane protein
VNTLRPLLLKLHRWTGLAVGILFLIQGLTGSTLVFRDEIERVIHPSTVVVEGPTRVPVQTLIDVVHAAHPTETITRVEFPRWSDSAALVKLTAHDGTLRQVSVDPFRGTIVRDGTLSAWPIELLFQIHYTLLAGDTGETIIGIEGLALLFMALTGPIVWWPGLKRLKNGFRVLWRGNSDRRWRTLHRAWGAGAAILLLTSATTGVLMVWKDQVRSTLQTFSTITAKPSPKVAAQPGRAMLPVDRMIARARAEYGATPLRQLRFSSKGRVVAIFLDSDLTVRPDGAKQVYYNAYTGADLGHYVSGALPASSEVVDWLYTVHTGLFGGIVTRVLFELSALSLVGLTATGLWLWYARRSRLKRRASTKAQPEMADAA